MTRKSKVVGTAVVAALMVLAFVAGGLVAVPQGDVSAREPAPGPVQGQPYQPPMPLGYETVPLDCEEVKVAAVQMVKVRPDPDNPQPGIDANVEIVLRLIDDCNDLGVRLAVFNEFTLGAGCKWTREQLMAGAIMVPGPETEAIGAKAEEYNMYIMISNLFQVPEWPGHFMNGTFTIGPSGEVINVQWKHYWGMPGIGFEYATTIYDVLDEYVKRYGWDAVNPVIRTPIGNLAGYVCSESFFHPEIARVRAMKGAEILCRLYGGSGWGNWSGRMKHVLIGDCAFNMVWAIDSNGGRATGPDDPANSSSGSSMIVDPLGNIVAMSDTIREDIVTWTIPIAEFRTTDNRYDKFGNPHMTPATYRGGVRTEIFVPEYENQPCQFPPNLLTKYQKQHHGELPPDFCSAREWYYANARYEFDYEDWSSCD